MGKYTVWATKSQCTKISQINSYLFNLEDNIATIFHDFFVIKFGSLVEALGKIHFISRGKLFIDFPILGAPYKVLSNDKAVSLHFRLKLKYL